MILQITKSHDGSFHPFLLLHNAINSKFEGYIQKMFGVTKSAVTAAGEKKL